MVSVKLSLVLPAACLNFLVRRLGSKGFAENLVVLVSLPWNPVTFVYAMFSMLASSPSRLLTSNTKFLPGLFLE